MLTGNGFRAKAHVIYVNIWAVNPLLVFVCITSFTPHTLTVKPGDVLIVTAIGIGNTWGIIPLGNCLTSTEICK